MNKDQLTKLALLDNPKTLKFLTNFALTKKKEIIGAKSNEEIIEHLELLNVAYYRVPEIVAWVIDYLLYKAKPLDTGSHKTPMGNFPGKSFDDVLVKSLEIAKNIRYYELEKCIQISFDYINHTNKNLASLATKLIEEIVEYNLQVLPKMGINPQSQALNFLEKKLKAKKYKTDDFSFTKIVLKNILETSLSKTAVMISPDTLSFSNGDINGHIHIAKIRRRAIDICFKLFQASPVIKGKLEIFSMFEQACHMPMHSSREDSLGKIVQKDRAYVLKKLSLITFKGKEIIQPLSICIQLEHFLFWHFIHIELQQEIATDFIKRLHGDSRYKLFRKFVHDDRYRYSKNKLTEVDTDPQKEVSSYTANISNNNNKEILEELEYIASEAKNVDEWKFISFKQLLEYIAEKKSDISFAFIKEITSKAYELSGRDFLPFLLGGLRRAGRFDLWDKSVEMILKEKNQEMLLSVISSFYMSHSINTEIIVRKKEDIDFLESFVKRDKQFSFYKETNTLFNYSTIHALRVAYKFDPKRIEKLTITELRSRPDYFINYLHNISIYSRKGEGFCLNNWSEKNKEFILGQMMEIRDLDWNAESILPLIASPVRIVDFFIQRIKYKNKNLFEKGEDYFSSSYRSYDPVPYHMNQELVEFIKSNPEIINQITKNISADYTSYSFEISQLIRNLHIEPKDILEHLSKKTKNVDTLIKQVVTSISSFDQNDPDFLVKLAGMTSNKSIHNELYGKLAATGVVSGEFGIADAYKNKRESLEKYKESENINIKKFVSMAIESLSYGEEQQRKEAEQEREIRRIDFESNK